MCLLQSTSLTAVGRLVRSVATVVLGVTLPPERDTLVVLADKLMRDVEEHISNEKWYVSLWSLRSWSGSSIMRSPGWRCSWTCTVSHQRPGRSSWDRHIYNLRPERADTSYCSRRCLSGTGDLWLQRETRERYITPKTLTISRQITSRHKTRSSKLGSISEECLWQWCV